MMLMDATSGVAQLRWISFTRVAFGDDFCWPPLVVTALNPYDTLPFGFDSFPEFPSRLPSDIASVAPHEIYPTSDGLGFGFV